MCALLNLKRKKLSLKRGDVEIQIVNFKNNVGHSQFFQERHKFILDKGVFVHIRFSPGVLNKIEIWVCV